MIIFDLILTKLQFSLSVFFLTWEGGGSDIIELSSDLKSIQWNYTAHNFTLAHPSTTHFVRSAELDPVGLTNNGLFGLYLDKPDEGWLSCIEGFDYVIVSSGHWFFLLLIFYVHKRGQIVGCHECAHRDVPVFPNYYGYRMAFRTAFRAINAPSHFENGTRIYLEN